MHVALKAEIQQEIQCPVCHNLSHVEYENLDDTLGDTQSDFIDFLDLRLDCESCRLLRRIVECYTQYRPTGSNSPNFQIGLYKKLGKPTMVELSGTFFRDNDREMEKVDETLMLYLKPGINCPILPTLGSLGTVKARSDSNDCFQFIQERLQRCISTHVSCSQPSNGPLPKRLLSLGDSSVRLLETQPAQHARYAALSHCWGTHQPIKTTISNLTKVKRSIPWSDLSAVFQDAIQVCGRLGVNLLWIDSLCIIQDSVTDWEIESAKMCDYYRNAHVTISAGSSPDGTIPFLAERNPDWLPRSFVLTDSRGGLYDVFACKALHKESDKLGTRAWVWQEQVLSSRVIHYSSSCLIWACREECVAENGWDETKHVTSHFAWDMTCQQWDHSITLGPHSAWRQAVESFSLLQLTYLADRLPAIGGVAALFSERMKCRYLAGHWEDDILRSLCWQVQFNPLQPDLTVAPVEFLAPTWSWVSTVAHIWYNDLQNFSPRATVEGVECTQLGLNPFGRVSAGYIEVRGSLVDGELTNDEDHINMSAYIVKTAKGGQPAKNFCVDYLLTTRDHDVLRARCGEHIITAPLAVKVCCLLLGEVGEAGSKAIFVLILSHCSKENTYCRLGLLQLDHADWFVNANEIVIRIK